MKKFFTPVFLFLVFLAGAGSVLAAGSDGLPEVTYSPPNKSATISGIVNKALGATLGMLGVIALVAFIYGGIIWMTSAGDTAKITKARKTMIWAVAGLVIIFAAFSILTLFFNAIGYATPGAAIK